METGLVPTRNEIKEELILKQIDSIPVFMGDRAELRLFAQQMDQVVALIQSLPRSSSQIKVLLEGHLVTKIDMRVMIELGSSYNDNWSQLKTRLFQRYGGSRMPPERAILRMMRMRREEGESTGYFAGRLLEAWLTVKDRQADSFEGSNLMSRLKVIAELLRELLYSEISKKAKTKLERENMESIEEEIKFLMDEEMFEAEERRRSRLDRQDKLIRKNRGTGMARQPFEMRASTSMGETAYGERQIVQPGGVKKRVNAEYGNKEVGIESLKFPGEIEYSDNLPDCAAACESLLNVADSSRELVLGFDLEWPFNYKAGPGRTSLIQICPDRSICYLFHVSNLRNLPRALVILLRHPRVKLVGLNIKNDFRKLGRDFGIDVTGILANNIVELSTFANEKLLCTEKWSLDRLVLNQLKVNLEKPEKVRMSNWAQENLTKAQLIYAATDAYASLLCYQQLRSIPSKSDSTSSLCDDFSKL